MSSIVLPRRGFLTGVGAAALLGLAGCASSASEGGAKSSAGNGFPVQIQHKYGTTTIPTKPERVVTVGLTEQDALLALGIVPVATTNWLGTYPGEIGPWAKKYAGHTTPKVLSNEDGIQFERIAALKPDLIIALYSDLKAGDYTKLSDVAPTVAPPAGVADFGIEWAQATKIVGKAVGKPERAQQLVTDVTAGFAAARADHPQFTARSAAMLTIYEGFFVYGKNDPRTQLLRELGFTFPADLDTFVGGEYGKSLSEERAAMLNLDALVWLLDDLAHDTATLHDSGLYARQPVVAQGRDVLIDSTSDYGNAISFVSVLSLPYVLSRIVPQLAAAVDGDPATTIPRT